MSVAATTMHDVFLSHGAHDTGIAGLVKDALAQSDLEVFSIRELKPGEAFMTKMRQALAECNVVVIILTRSTLGSSNVAFEIGAAMAWNKPVYVLYDGISKNEIPSFLRDFRIFQISKLSKVVREIAEARQPFSDEDRESLVRVYEELGVATDQLLQKPVALHELSERYNSLTHSAVGGEKLVQELIRLRKQGKLPKVTKK